MKRLLLILIALVMIFSSFAAVRAPAKADTGLTAMVLASQLNIRSSGSIHGGILTEANWGDVLVVLGRNQRATWLKIVAADGTVGWVSAFWVQLSKNIPRSNLPIVS